MRKIKELLKKIPIIHFVIKHIIMFFYSAWCKVVEVLYEIDRFLIRRNIKMEKEIYAKIEKYKNKYKDQRCFIVATGPSLTIEDLNKLHECGEYTFAMNTIVNAFDKTDFRPTFYCIQDKEVYQNVKDKITTSHISDIFVGISNVPLKRTRIAMKELIDGENVTAYRLNAIYHWMQVIYGTLKPELRFSLDCSKEVFDGNTVAYSIIQLAQYMGFKEIYLLGADCDYAGKVDHFDGTKTNAEPSKGNAFIKSYSYAKKYLDNTDVQIYNATRGGKLEVFPRVNFDELF